MVGLSSSLAARPFLLLLPLFFALFSTCLSAHSAAKGLNPVRSNVKSLVFVTTRPLTENDIYAAFPHKGTGPGFIVDRQGHVVCASSVISDVHSIEVTLHDRSFWPAVLVGIDKELGIALVRIKAPEKVMKALSPLKIPDSWNLSLGETVWALGVTSTGRPLAAKGIVAVPEREIMAGDRRYQGLIQTTIPVNSSLNGGPLLDSVGKLVGMNIRLDLQTAGSAAGFALNADTLERAIQRIVEGGCSSKIWLGATFIPIDPTLARLLGLPQDRGLLLVRVEKSSPAGRAGLRGSSRELRLGNKIYPIGGDFLVAVDRTPVEDEESLRRVLDSKEPGTTVLVSIYRGGRLIRLPVTLAAKGCR